VLLLVLETLSVKILPTGSSQSARQKSLLAHLDVWPKATCLFEHEHEDEQEHEQKDNRFRNGLYQARKIAHWENRRAHCGEQSRFLSTLPNLRAILRL
jgi:hypothetical protein